MTTKDWVLLLTPILANGVILYLLQLYFQTRLKRSDHKNEIKQKISSAFFSMLLEIKASCRTLGRCAINSPDDLELFNNNLAIVNQNILKTLEYYSDYEYYLKDYSSIIKQLDATFDEYMKLGRSLTYVNEISRAKLQTLLNRLFKLASNAAELYVKSL